MKVMVEGFWTKEDELYIGFRLVRDDMMMIMILQTDLVINLNLLTTQAPSKLGAMNAASLCPKCSKMLIDH